MWKCPDCGEGIEDQFDACWNCAGRREEGVPGQTPRESGATAPTEEGEPVCVHCGSHRMIPNAVLGDQGQYSDGKARVKVYSSPDAFVFKGAVYAEVVASLCCECGRLDFRAVGNLQSLWNAHRQAKRKR